MMDGVTISVQGLKESLAYLMDELDRLIEERTAVDAAVEQAIREILNIVVYEGETSGEDKTLIQLVNDVYQSHLSGDDNGNRPAYIDTVMAGLNGGTLLPALVNGIVEALWNAVVEISGEISMSEFTGIGKVNVIYDEEGAIDAFDPQPLEGRGAPLVIINEDGSSPVLVLLFQLVLSSKMDKTDADENGKYEYWQFKESATVKDLLGNALLGFAGLDIPEMLGELLLGTPATDDEPASEGLLTEDVQATIVGFLGGIIDSMSQDSNFAGDGDAVIVVADRPLPTVQEIAVTDFDLDYTVGDEFAGGKVLAVYSDGTTEKVDLTADMMSGFDTAATGKKTVTVTYGGKTVTVEIEVAEAAEVPDNGNNGTADGNEDNNASGGTDSGDSKGCGAAISVGTGAAIAGVVLLAAGAVILLRKRAANK